jgi:hydrogenase maturation factor
MKLGKEAMEVLQAETTGRLLPGDELVVVGAVALKGTVLITEEKYEPLSHIFSAGFLQESRSLFDDHGVGMETKGSQAWKMAETAGASALYPLGEGGFLSGLWKMAEGSGVGLDVDLRKIPIRQESIEICEIFDVNPYKLNAKGAILIGIRGGEALVQEYRRMGLMAAVIGQTNGGNDRLLYSGENARYLERPAEDEWNKIKSRQ